MQTFLSALRRTPWHAFGEPHGYDEPIFKNNDLSGLLFIIFLSSAIS